MVGMYRQHRQQFLRGARTAAFVSLFLVALSGAKASDDIRQYIDPATEKAVLLKVQNGQAIWMTSELHPETARHHAQRFTHRLYRQPIGQSRGELASQYVGGPGGPAHTAIGNDGSILMLSGDESHFIRATGEPIRQHHLEWHNVVALYPMVGCSRTCR